MTPKKNKKHVRIEDILQFHIYFRGPEKKRRNVRDGAVQLKPENVSVDVADARE